MRTNNATGASARTFSKAGVGLADAANSLFGDDFWGRERVNPGPSARLTTRAVPRRR